MKRKRYSLVRSAEPPRPATSIATLRGETEVGGAAIGLSSPSRTDIKEKRYGRLWPDKPSTDSHPDIPPAPKGDNRPGGGVPARPSVPRIRALNIIPSELCNSRRHRQCPAPTASARHTPGARRTGQQGVRLHNPDYVKCLRQCGAKVLPSNLPGEAVAGEGLAAVAGSVPALCQPRTGQRNWGPNFPNSSTRCNSAGASVSLHRHHPLSASVQREHPAALCSEAAGRPVIKGQQSGQARQLAFDAVPPR